MIFVYILFYDIYIEYNVVVNVVFQLLILLSAHAAINSTIIY
jgi:hypothetical protein